MNRRLSSFRRTAGFGLEAAIGVLSPQDTRGCILQVRSLTRLRPAASRQRTPNLARMMSSAKNPRAFENARRLRNGCRVSRGILPVDDVP